MYDTFVTMNALGVIFLQVFLVALVIGIFTKARWVEWVKKNSQLMLFILFAGATLGSLTYSEFFDLAPCMLCWYQRIAIYSNAILLGRGVFLKRSALGESLTLSLFGLAIAIVHNVLDIFQVSNKYLCETQNEVSDCLVQHVSEFGYITMPLMSLTVLLLGAVLSYLGRKSGGNPQKHVA